MKALSIYIPTWNRANYLADLLDSLLKSVIGHEDEVEILISDNASDDATRDLVIDYVSQVPIIHYHRNDINIRDGNFLQAPYLCSGRYIWLLGDDDKITEDAVTKVLDAIIDGPGLVVLGFAIYSKDLADCLNPSFFGDSHSYVIEGRSNILKKFGVGLGFISCVIMERELLLRVPREKLEKISEVGFSPFYSAYAVLAQRESIRYITGSHLIQRSSNERFDDASHLVTVFLKGSSIAWRYLSELGYSFFSIRGTKKSYYRNTLFKLTIAAKLRNAPILKLIGLSLPGYASIFLFWFGTLPLLLIPTPILKVVKRFNQLIKRK